ncbi:DUF6282 family protein [Brevibacterium luteolum]|nr:DUF6282 family protein [Brevibacterium luteolum]
MRRRISDTELAPRFQERGMSGFVLKSHYVPTAERAEAVRSMYPEVDVRGAITLNASVGGMNPVAVEIAGRGGAQIVWFPTVDSDNQRCCLAEEPEGATPPMWARLQDDLRSAGIQSPSVEVVDDTGTLTPRVLQVLDVIAAHDMTLATGHLHGDESAKIVAAARARGVRRIVVTHPEFTSQRIPASDQRELTGHGAYLERCLTTPLTGKVNWEVWLGNIREAGASFSVISSDLGQPFNPPVEDGLAIAADILLENGFSELEVRLMIVHNSRWLAGAPPLSDAPEAHRIDSGCAL